MNDLFRELGIDWRLLLSQAANFLILLVVLRLFVYGPLMKVLAQRRARIEEGIMKAAEADVRLSEANQTAKEKLKEADTAAAHMIEQTRQRARHEEEKMRETLAEKEAARVQSLEEEMAQKKAQMQQQMEHEESALIKEALAKVVALAPDAIDDALIARALSEVRK